MAYEIPDDYDPTDISQAQKLVNSPGIPLGVVYKNESDTIEDRFSFMKEKAKVRSNEEILNTYSI